MKKVLSLAAAILLAVGAVSCTFPGTATVSVSNKSDYTITAVNFVAISGGVTDNNSVTISPDETHCFYGVKPGTYRIDMTAEGVSGTKVFDASETVEEGTVYPRLVYNSTFE